MNMECLGGPASRALLLSFEQGGRVLLDCGATPRLRQHTSTVGGEHAHSIGGEPAAPQPCSAAGQRVGPSGAQAEASRQAPVAADGTPDEAAAPPALPAAASVGAALELEVGPLLGRLADRPADALLVSSPQGLLGLPHLWEQQLMPPCVYATVACLNLAHAWASELAHTAQQLQHDQWQREGAAASAQPPLLQQSLAVQHKWARTHVHAGNAAESGSAEGGARDAECTPMFDHEQLQAALQAVTAVRYGQRVKLFEGSGGQEVVATAVPSGCGMGGTCWLLAAGGRELAYMSDASYQPGHARPFEPQQALGSPAALLLARGACSAQPLLQPAAALAHIQQAAAAAVHQGGRVLVPLNPTGTAFDLIEALAAGLQPPGALRPAPPLLYIGPAAAASLAAATTGMEFLDRARQARVLGSAEAPFAHEGLKRERRLLVAASPEEGGAVMAQALAGPCVALVPAASLAAGAGAELLRRWGDNPACLLLLVEPGCDAWLDTCLHCGALVPVKAPIPANGTREQAQPAVALPEQAAAVQPLLQQQQPRRAPLIMPSGGQHQPLQAAQQPVQLLQPQQQTQQQLPPLGPQRQPQQLRMRVLRVPYAPMPALTAADVGRLAVEAQSPQLLAYAGEEAGIQQALQTCPRMGAHAQCSVTPYALGAALAIPVPPPMIEVEISKPLARHIQVAPVGTSGGGAARVRGVLRPQPQGGWRLEPLPKHAAGAPGAAPVAGVAEQLPEQQKVLLWGQVAVEPLLAALQAAGFYWTSVCNEPAQPLPLAGSTRGSSEHAQSLRVAEGAESASEHAQPPAAQGGIGSVSAPGQPPPAERHAGAGTEGARPVVVVRIAEADGEIRLEDGETHVFANNRMLRHKLLECVTQQLHEL